MARVSCSKPAVLDPLILKIKLLIVLPDLTHDPAGIADGDHPRGDIVGHHGACADDRVVSDGHAGHDEGTCADPTVVADAYRGVVLETSRPELGVDGMAGGGDCDVGGEKGVVTHVDVGVVHHGQIEVGVDVVAEMDVFAAPVGVKGGLNIATLPDLGEHFLHEGLSLIHLGGTGVVELVQPVKAGGLLGHNVPVGGVVEHSGVHFL